MIMKRAVLKRPNSCENKGTLVDVVGSKTSARVSPPTRLIKSPAICIPLSRMVMPSPNTTPIINSLARITT